MSSFAQTVAVPDKTAQMRNARSLPQSRPAHGQNGPLQSEADLSPSTERLKGLSAEAENAGAVQRLVQLKARADHVGEGLSSPGWSLSARVIQRAEGDDVEGAQESWASWLWRYKWWIVGAGITLAAAYLLYKNSGGAPPGSGGGGGSAAAGGGGASAATGGATSAVTDSGGGSGGTDGGGESIWAMSLRQTISGPQPGDAAPPCPLDPVTGGPNLDAWGDLIEKAVEPMIQSGIDKFN